MTILSQGGWTLVEGAGSCGVVPVGSARYDAAVRRLLRNIAGWVVLGGLACGPGCRSGEEPSYVDMARVAEALRVARPALSESCSGGFSAFARAAAGALAEIDGAERYRAALERYARREAGRPSSEQLAEPALLRLLLHRYASICRLPRARELEPRLAELSRGESGGRARAIESLLIEALGEGARGEAAESSGDRLVAIDLDGGAGDPVVLLACLGCRAEASEGGVPQLIAAVAALGATRDSSVRLARPVRLLICLDAEQHLDACRSGMSARDQGAFAALALDGMQPLVVAWSGEGTWSLALAHRPLPARPRRASRRSERPLVIDASAGEGSDRLPERASLRLIPQSGSVEELAEQVRGTVEDLSEQRPDARYEVGVEGDQVVVSAAGEPLPAWRIDGRRNALWDLAALTRSLRAVDPPGGSISHMLNVVTRFDADPYGARLGLYYEDPVGGPLLVAPTTLAVRGDRVELGFRLYRPPGLARRDFVARLDEARRRLRIAVGRPVFEVSRELGEPSRVAPDSDQVRLIRRAFEEVTGEPPPEPGGAPRPGLAALLPQAVSLGLPPAAGSAASDRAASLLVELVWCLSVAPRPEVLRRSRWR